jgi:PAS domain S-box-containing protein
MTNAEFQLRGVGDPRLAVHATSSLPAWLWSVDGRRILWANPVGAVLFDAPNGAALANKTFGPANPHRRQVAQLAYRLPPLEAVRLERLRGFGAALGGLMTCACARLHFADGGAGILVVAIQPSGRVMPLIERLQRLVADMDLPIAAFAPDGGFVAASEAARAWFDFRNLSEAGFETARNEALRQGRVATPIALGHLVLQRVGFGNDIGLVALIEAVRPADPLAGDDEAPASAASEPIPEPAATLDAQPENTPMLEPFEPQPVEDLSVEDSLVEDSVTAVADVADAECEAAAGHEPSPYVEPVADEPLAAQAEPPPRQHPLRMLWRTDAQDRFSLDPCEFTDLIGVRSAASFDRPWHAIADALGLDPQGRVSDAIASHQTWSGITLNWTTDSDLSLPVELSGLPVYDRDRFAGYRGFGVCRDLDALTRLASLRHHAARAAARGAAAVPLSADFARNSDIVAAPPVPQPPAAQPIIEQASQPDPEKSLDTPKNVLPFRPINDVKSPTLTPVENNAFNELAKQLATRLDAEKGAPTRPWDARHSTSEVSASEFGGSETADHDPKPAAPEPATAAPAWLSAAQPPAQAQAARDKPLFDLLPVGVLIYRLDRLLYANRAFLDRIGYDSLSALEAADGLDALFVEPAGGNGSSTSGSSTSGNGTAVTIAATPASADRAPLPPTEARLYAISWDGDSALALICSNTGAEVAPLAVAAPVVAPVTAAVTQASAVGHADAEELGAILDTTAEGVVMFDANGSIHACNRSAEALFGYDGADLTQRNLADLFAPESQRVVLDYLESTKGAGVASLLDHGREVLGRVSKGGLVPLSMTVGRTRAEGVNFFAVFRDLSQLRTNEAELLQARRQADRAANAKSDMLARISHEVRTPLNAIIGFAEVMIDERFGTLGNERYIEYMKDIRASGERVIDIVNDLLDLSRIETGKIDLAFANQNLNELVESCVAVMQPQANRERIIIRTSLAHTLPLVIADARALRQITLNLIGSSIHLANAGGQVIVSTALSDFGEVVLRVRDTGHSLNDNELAAAMEPFRAHGLVDQTSDGAGVSLSLTKALVEANRAQFQIKTAPHSGTLIEVMFSRAVARA